MVSSGGSEVGAAKLTGEVLDIMSRLPSTVEKLTGVKISQVTALTSACWSQAVDHMSCNVCIPT